MAKKREQIDPLARLSQQGFLGYVEEAGEETEVSPYRVIELAPDDILDSYYQSRERRNAEKFEQLTHTIKVEGFNGVLLVSPHPSEPGKYQLVAGGHSRRDAAKAADLEKLPCLVVEFDQQRMGMGTATENLVREDLCIPDEGALYLLLRQDFHWTQEELAERLDISRDRIKECEVAARDANDIQEMLRVAGDRGLRAAKALRQLDKLDDPAQGIERAAAERAPLIQQFLQGELTTDGLQYAVDAIFAKYAEKTSPGQEPTMISTADIRRQERITTVFKRFGSWQKLVGDNPPLPEEHQILQQLAQEIQAYLTSHEEAK